MKKETKGIVTKAKEFAYKAHKGQTRKGKGVPFTTHLESVSSIVSGLTNNDNLIAAAWLHDVVEDTPVTIDELDGEFGSSIANLVRAETEDKMIDISPLDSWEKRKELQIRALSREMEMDPSVGLIAFADKLSNLREMKEDYILVGDKIWDRFNQKDLTKQRAYYLKFYSLTKDLKALKNTELTKEMKEIIEYLFPID